MKYSIEIMIQKFLSLCVICSLSLVPIVMGQGTAEYKLTFKSTWTSTTHPDNYPDGPHFSPLIGATHNSSVTFWSSGSTASDGIESMAETGGTTRFRSEISQAISASNAGAIISGSGLGRPPTSTSTTFTVTASFPLVTVTSMLAPSPDWFVGVSGLDLSDGNNNWKSREEVTLYVYDAGSDSGTDYTSGNDNTNPKENIRRINESPFLVNGSVTPVGTFVFELLISMTIDVSSNAVTVPEGGQSTFTVRLGSAPSSTVTVTLSEFSNTDLERRPATLEFSTTDYSTPKTVTITAEQDTDSVNDPSETLTLTASGGGYTNVTQSVTVNITDDDEIAMEVSPSPIRINEGESGTYSVRLKSQPTGTVTVSIRGSVSVTPSSLTFSTTTWATNQTVTVTGEEDDDAIDEDVILTHSASGGGYGSAPTVRVTVKVIDNEQAELMVNPTSLNVDEGATAMYTVRLNTLPSATVSVDVSTNSPDVTVRPSTLTFTTTNWNQPQDVTVRAGQDDDASNDRIIINHSASGGNFGSVSKVVNVTVTDDDDVDLVITPSSITLLEGTSETYMINLATEPLATVTIDVTGGSGIVSVDTDHTTQGSQSTLTFSTSNWNNAQTITVVALEDDDESNHEITLTHRASGADYASVEETINISVVDNDDPGLMVIPTSLNVNEGVSAVYTVQLSTQPTGEVTVTVSGASGDVTIDTDTNTSGNQTTMTFTTSNWDNAQTVTVSAGEDDDASNDLVTLTNTASGANYDSVESVDVEVTVEDDEIAGAAIVASPTTFSVDEGSSETFEVSLAAQPSGDVDVMIAAFSASSLERVPTSLTFSPTNYDNAQVVTITASHDHDVEDESDSILLTASGGGYDQAASLKVAVTVIDDDTPKIILSGVSVEVDEGSTADVGVSLATIPTADVEVSISGFTASTLDRTPSTLTFTSQNYDQPQPVTISADQDFNTINEIETLTLTGSGGGYNGTSATVSVMVLDDDVGKPTVNLSVSPNPVSEGAPATITATLSEALSGSPVTVPVVFSNDSAESTDYEPVASIVINANQITDSAELVTNEDDDFDDEVLDISFGVLPDVILPGATTSITMTIQDNDTEMVSVVFTQNIIGSEVDLYVGDTLIEDNFAFQSASSHDIEIGTMKMDVVAPDAADNTTPLYTKEIDFKSGQDYHIVLVGQDTNQISTVEIADSLSDTSIHKDSVSVHIAHNAPDLGQIRLEIIDPEANNELIKVLSENLMYRQSTPQVFLSQRPFNLAVNGGSSKHDSVIEVYSVDWSQSSQQKGILILSGSGQSAAEGCLVINTYI